MENTGENRNLATLFRELQSGKDGLDTALAASRRAPVTRMEARWKKDLKLFLSQFKSPLVLLLVVSLILSSVLGEVGNSMVIFMVLFLTGILGFVQERNAGAAIEQLRRRVGVKAAVRRNGKIIEVHADEVVAGDVVELSAGDVIPGDGIIFSSKDLYVNESVLTGESFPAEKSAAPADAVPDSIHKVFRGTDVISGEASVLIISIGSETELGKIETRVGSAGAETAFEKGVAKFGHLIMRVSLIFTGIILTYNIVAGKPAQESLLFALAISVGLTPELLPSIITITLSAGAKRLSTKKVVVKRLASIQNLGAIDVLCSDKTGTLTEGTVSIHGFSSPDSGENPKIKTYAYLNAKYETGFSNPIDDAIRALNLTGTDAYEKVDEVPYDFIRKRLSIVVTQQGRHEMITKGSLLNVLEVCTQVELNDGRVVPVDEQISKKMDDLYHRFSSEGYRILGVAYKDVTDDPVINKEDESGMTFLGFILLTDPLKKGIGETIDRVEGLGITLKLITGDNALIAHHVARELNIQPDRVITGAEVHRMTDVALVQAVKTVDIFAEIVPSQKEQIVRALQKAGFTVGYLGDGINDASALKTADVGITVDNAVDVARAAADMVLLEKDLHVLCDGVEEGRKTYLNTLKYIFITTSANFGNMASMALASVLLPFLPLLPLQVLLVNFLTDIPSLAISSDRVDPVMLTQPRKWNMTLIWKFMLTFGLISSLFDFITFGALYYYFHATPELFRTGWFIESVITEILILFVIRSRYSAFRSKPGGVLLLSSAAIFILVIILPFLPGVSLLNLVPLPMNILAGVILIALVYAISGEITKRFLFRKLKF